MKKNYVLYLLVLLIFSACAPKYGAHFQSYERSSYANAKEVKAEEKQAPEAVSPELVQKLEPAESLRPAPLLEETALVSSETNMHVPVSKPALKEDALLKQIQERLASMSEKERKAIRHQLKEAVKSYKAKHNIAEAAPNQTDENTLLLVIVAILLPPLAMFLYEGDITGRFWISLLLTLLFYFPGLIYTLIVILGNK
jgi:uncharacterized membrane protein YqaE (UPF0057 family)